MAKMGILEAPEVTQGGATPKGIVIQLFRNFLISCDVWWTSVYILGRFVGGVTCIGTRKYTTSSTSLLSVPKALFPASRCFEG